MGKVSNQPRSISSTQKKTNTHTETHQHSYLKLTQAEAIGIRRALQHFFDSPQQSRIVQHDFVEPCIPLRTLSWLRFRVS